MGTKATRMAIWLRIFCAALLLSLGFAHKPLLAAPSLDPENSYYVLPDGSFAGLCIDAEVQGEPVKGWPGCEACRLACDVIPPAPAAGGLPILHEDRGIEFLLRSAILDVASSRPGSPVRGPPSRFA